MTTTKQKKKTSTQKTYIMSSMDPHKGGGHLTCKGTRECIDGAFNTLKHNMKTATPSEQFQILIEIS
jgi:hypothetical protein